MGLPPGPSRRIPLFAALALVRGRLALLRDLTDEYGDVVYFKVGGVQYAILNRPEFARDVLVTRHRLFRKGLGLERTKVLFGEGLLTSEGELHGRQRRLIQPAFQHDRITACAGTMVEYTRRRSDSWTSGAVFDIAREMEALTLAVAAKTLFDADVDDELTELASAVDAGLGALNLLLLPYGDRLMRLIVPRARRFRRARERLDTTVFRLIAERRRNGAVAADALSILVSACTGRDVSEHTSDKQIRDEVITLLLAGHETTANALTWTFYLLSQHAEVEQKLQEEIDQVLAGRLPTADDVSRLTYTRAVLTESMRLFPPAPLVGRCALAAYDVPGTPYVLPAETVVLISQFLLHRDPRFWDTPQRFEPTRWIDPGRRTVDAESRQAFFPFGAGPRTCIGEHFAWMEGTLVLATLVQRWQFRLVPGHRVEPQAILTLRAKHGIRMTCLPRREGGSGLRVTTF